MVSFSKVAAATVGAIFFTSVAAEDSWHTLPGRSENWFPQDNKITFINRDGVHRTIWSTTPHQRGEHDLPPYGTTEVWYSNTGDNSPQIWTTQAGTTFTDPAVTLECTFVDEHQGKTWCDIEDMNVLNNFPQNLDRGIHYVRFDNNPSERKGCKHFPCRDSYNSWNDHVTKDGKMSKQLIGFSKAITVLVGESDQDPEDPPEI